MVVLQTELKYIFIALQYFDLHGDNANLITTVSVHVYQLKELNISEITELTVFNFFEDIKQIDPNYFWHLATLNWTLKTYKYHKLNK